jgi:excisionase family DNA binding protein
MGREKVNFREQLGLLNDLFPGKITLTVSEAASVLGVDRRTVRAMIERKYNPLPAQIVGKTNNKTRYIIPKTAVARFSAGG